MNHLSFERRYTIAVMYQNDIKKAEISALLGRNKSVISREINLNCDKRTGKIRSGSYLAQM